MHEVRLPVRSPDDLRGVVSDTRVDWLQEVAAPRIREFLGDRAVINVNSTEAGGGVAEMLHVLLPFTMGAGVAARWFVIEGEPEFFAITKRLHNHLHGSPGDGGPLGENEREFFRTVARVNAGPLLEAVTPGDAVILHDPQPAGLAAILQVVGVPVVWRCHVGVDHENEFTKKAWDFLRPMLEPHTTRYVFTRESYAPDWVPRDALEITCPSIDPLSPKNQELSDHEVESIISGCGLFQGTGYGGTTFQRQDGTRTGIGLTAQVVREDGPIPLDVPIVMQVSRWDPLKDMSGVMWGFVNHVIPHSDAHLLLVGPSVSGVSDDPEGAGVLSDVTRDWHGMPEEARKRVHLVSLPMDDPEANAVVVNALQRHALVVVQKSLAEGFGLTVTEAMYKGRAMVASAIGGITDQITDGHSGLLVQDPNDRAEFGSKVLELVNDPAYARRLGEAAKQKVIDDFLPDSSLARWYRTLMSAAGLTP